MIWLYWQQFEEIASASRTVFFDRKGWKQQHKRKQAKRKRLVQLGSENHALLESGRSRTCTVEKNMQSDKLSNEIYCKINARDVLFSVNLVTYMSISEVLVKTCWFNGTTAKIWNLPNFCQFFARHCPPLLSGVSTDLTVNFFNALLQFKFNFTNTQSTDKLVQISHTILIQCSDHASQAVLIQFTSRQAKVRAHTALTPSRVRLACRSKCMYDMFLL